MQKTILMTGCSSGIGLRAAEILHNCGYRVFATARKEDDVYALQKQSLESLRLDVTDSSSIKNALNDILQRTNGTLDALFNNAGYGQPGAVEDLTRSAMRAQFETNVFGVQELIHRVLPVMRKQGYGRIINVSSVLGMIALPYRGAYSASKYALEGLTDALRLELHGSRIFVSLIEPGPIKSQFRDSARLAYQQIVAASASAHNNNYQRMLSNFNKDTSMFTQSPDAVVKKLLHALESRRPKSRYYVTLPTYLLAFAKRILPNGLLDSVLRLVVRQEIK